MSDFTSAAEGLYGAPEAPQAPAAPRVTPTAPRPAPAAPVAPVVSDDAAVDDFANDEVPPAPPTVEQLVAAIGENTPAKVREQRVNDDARKIYDAQTAYASVIPDDLFDQAGMAPELQTAVAAEVREIAKDIGLEVNDVEDIRRALQRPAPTTKQEVADAWGRVVDEMNRHFGMQAASAFADARAFVNADTRRVAILGHAGLDARVIVRLAVLARQAKTR